MSAEQKVQGRIFLLARKPHNSRSPLQYIVSGCEMPDLGYVTVASRDVEMDVPDGIDPAHIALQSLEAEKKHIQKQAQQDIKSLEERMQELKADTANKRNSG